MLKKYHVCLVMFFAVIALIAGIFLPRIYDRSSPQPEIVLALFEPSSFIHARRIIGYEQPSPELIRKISVIYGPEDKDKSTIPESMKSMDGIVVNWVPFQPYWQSETEQYAFHPMRLGEFLENLDCNEPIERYVNAAVGMAHELPNGGLLWYYPDNYRLNRFLGPDLSPSAIGQAQILGAITSLDRRCGLDLADIAHRTFLGLRFSYYHGGLNLEDKALLEIPLFRSAPEIILNGWLHALLLLRNYVEHYRDPYAEKLLKSNLAFLAESLGNFHDEKTGLSLYSDLAPYRVRVHHEGTPSPRLTVFYKARIEGFDDLRFDLTVIPHDTKSPYDNQIIRQTRSFTDIWLSCSKNYETFLVSDVPISVSFSTGEYSPYRSTPGRGGEQIELKSVEVDGFHVVHITSVRDKLFCGYPTNFSKMGENYYHTYHVVALAVLLASIDLPEKIRKSLKYWMEKWIRTIESPDFARRGLKFASYDKILKDLNEHGVFTLTDNWETLLRMARGVEE